MRRIKATIMANSITVDTAELSKDDMLYIRAMAAKCNLQQLPNTKSTYTGAKSDMYDFLFELSLGADMLIG